MELLDLREFRRLARDGEAPAGSGISAPSTIELLDAGSRTVRFIFSDGSVDRVSDTIDPNGWDLRAFKRNPVILWAHNALEPPIGRCTNLFTDYRGLVGDVQFADRDTYEFADTIYRQIKAGFLHAGSVGFLPIDYSLSKDPDRPYGIDFKKQELLEFSIVPIPANANALVTAAAKSLAGFSDDTEPYVDDIEERRRRTARLAIIGGTGRRSLTDDLPPRSVLRLQFAGTLADRDRQVDRAYPGLAQQELRTALASANRESIAGRLAVLAAYDAYDARKAICPWIE